MRYLLLFVLSFFTILILWVNLALHSKEESRIEQEKEVRAQLNFLEKELKHNNLGDRMQHLFPEGYVFIHALYGLSWCELSLSYSSDKGLKKKAVEEALYAFNQLNNEKATSNFQIELVPEYGIFYSGWKNYLLSKILKVDRTFKGHEFYEALLEKQSNEIIAAIKLSKSPYIDSYNGHAWPADMFVAMASVSNYNKLYNLKLKPEVNVWLAKVKKHLDPETQMIPHKIDAETGAIIEGTRGCSIGLSLRMLAEIDQEFGKQQFNLAKTSFITTRFGLPAMREYPQGIFGLGDVDSGPVILGVGFSATIVMIGTMSMYDEPVLANEQYKTIHAFGFKTSDEDGKKYLFGTLPMADAFIAWGRATDLNCTHSQPNVSSRNWRLTFHLTSLFVLTTLWLLFYRSKVKSYINRVRSQNN